MSTKAALAMLGSTAAHAAGSPGQRVVYLTPRLLPAWAEWKRRLPDASHDDTSRTTSFPNGSTVEFRAP